MGGGRWEAAGCILYSFGTPFKLSSKSNILRPLWTILDSLAPWGHFGEIFEEVGGRRWEVGGGRWEVGGRR